MDIFLTTTPKEWTNTACVDISWYSAHNTQAFNVYAVSPKEPVYRLRTVSWGRVKATMIPVAGDSPNPVTRDDYLRLSLTKLDSKFPVVTDKTTGIDFKEMSLSCVILNWNELLFTNNSPASKQSPVLVTSKSTEEIEAIWKLEHIQLSGLSADYVINSSFGVALIVPQTSRYCTVVPQPNLLLKVTEDNKKELQTLQLTYILGLI